MSTPPPPLPPFASANDVDTEPGIGMLSLKQELAKATADNDRLRRERNEARATTTSASIPPPKTAGGVTMGAVKWLGVASLLLTAAAQLAAAYKPGLVGPIQHMIDIVKGLQ